MSSKQSFIHVHNTATAPLKKVLWRPADLNIKLGNSYMDVLYLTQRLLKMNITNSLCNSRP
jgi:hypothetical protein